MVDSRLFNSLEWRCIGPHRGGRVTAVAGHPTEKGTFYFGACAGGVWKTTNGGSHWRNISDGYFKTAAIGAMALAPSDPNVIYVGTGESTIRSNVSHGDGVYKSTDGGRTWQHVGLAETRHIGDVVVHPDDPNTVYVAALGNAFGENPERGVFRSTDGGRTWARVLHKSDRAGSTDIAMDGGNPRILYANIFQVRRYPHTLDSTGEDCGLWRSFDGGDTWEEISRNRGLPQEGNFGKIGVATTAARPGRVYAIVEHEQGALYRSDDYGDTWKKLCDNPDLRRRPWYYMHIVADPSDADTVWVLNVQYWKSIDGGQTFTSVAIPHGDNHALWIDPRDSNRQIQGNDGGACVTFDGGKSWSSILNQPTAQFYHVTTDHRTPYNVYGSQQDNWAMMLPSISFEGAITWKDYVEPGGGESGYIAIKPTEPYTVYGGGIGTGPGDGRLLAWNPQTRQIRNVTVWPESRGYGAFRQKYRFQWTFPIEISPHDPETVYVCSQYVHRSTDEGTSWEIISPDLTRNDPDKLQFSGGPITPERGAAEMYCTIFAFRESPHRAGLFWAGTDDGRVHISKDGGQSWQEITPPAELMPEWSKVSIIEPSPHDEATAYMAVIRYMHGDPNPYLYKTSDYGETWTKMTNGIPEGEFTRVIREDPNRRGLLYAGTETGLYISFDDGQNWQPFQCNLPVCPIHDLVIKGTDLIAATHGRSFWILDDLSPLYQIDGATAQQAAVLFEPRPATRYKVYGRMLDLRNPKPDMNFLMAGPVTVGLDIVETPTGIPKARFLDAGENPPDGAILHYWLASEPGELTLKIEDEAGNEVVSFSNDPDTRPRLPAAAGANRFVWDLRYGQPVNLVDAGELPVNLPAKAIPGTYRVTLTVDGSSYTQPLTIAPDPRLPWTVEDLAAQRDLKLALCDRVGEIHEAANRIRRMKEQIEAVTGRPDATDALKEQGEQLTEKLTEIEGKLVNIDPQGRKRGATAVAEKLKTLAAMIDEGDSAPTRQMGEVFDAVSEEIGGYLEDLTSLMERDVAAFNASIAASGLAPVR